MTHPPSTALEMPRTTPAGKPRWAALRHLVARMFRPAARPPHLDAVTKRHQADLGLTHRDMRAISSLPLSVDAFAILAIRDCGRTKTRHPDI